MRNEEKIIEETINKYLISEGWFNKPEVHITEWDDNSKTIIGFDVNTREEVRIVPQISNKKVKNIIGFYQQSNKKTKVEIENYPSDDGYLYGGATQNNYHWAWDIEDSVVYFYYDSRQNKFLDLDNEPIKVYCYPQSILQSSLNQSQGQGGNQQQRQSQGQGGNQQQGQQNNGERRNYGNIPTNHQSNQPSREEILNPNEEHPLSNAILRLVRERYLQDSRRARNLINNLWQIGY